MTQINQTSCFNPGLKIRNEKGSFIKSITIAGDILRKNMICLANDEETIKKRLVMWCEMHEHNVKDVIRILF